MTELRRLPWVSLALSLTFSCSGGGPGTDGEEPFWDGDVRHSRTFSSSDDFGAGVLNGLNADSSGQVQMNAGLNLYDTPFIWIPNSTERTVSKIDTQTLEVLGTYLLIGPDGEDCYNPSRTTVDLAGNVWVGCRGESSYINREDIPAGGVPVQVDNKVVKISRDDGRVLLSLRVGHAPRALALDASNHLWVGCSVDDTIWEIDGDTGACYRGEGPGCAAPAIAGEDFPYGLAVDQRGHLWVLYNRIPTRQPDLISEIDSVTGEIYGVYGPYLRDGCNDLYGIAIDPLNDVWTGGFDCDDVVKVKGITGTSPATGLTYEAGEMIGAYDCGGETSRGVAIDMDGNVWVAMSGTNTATKIAGNSGEILQTVNVGAGPIGVGVDAFGNAWVVNRGQDSVHRINGLDTTIKEEITVGFGPYTYSDMLGMALRTITHRSESFSFWRGVIDSGLDDPSWEEVAWNAYEPSATDLQVRARCAAERDLLNTAPWGAFREEPGAIDCGGQSGRYAELEARFFTHGGTTASPILYDLSVFWR